MRIKKKIDVLCWDYKCATAEGKGLIRDTLKIVNPKLAQMFDVEIFIRSQKPLYSEIAQMLIDDIIKYWGGFTLNKNEIEALVDNMQFRDDVPEDVYKANVARVEALDLDSWKGDLL